MSDLESAWTRVAATLSDWGVERELKFCAEKLEEFELEEHTQKRIELRQRILKRVAKERGL
jgi:hypothetical protein